MDRLLAVFALVAIFTSPSLCEDNECEMSGATPDTYIDTDLKELAHKIGTLTFKDSTNKNEYTLSMCQTVATDPAVTVKTAEKTTSLGVTNQVETALNGKEWALISFGGGENYTDGNCAKKPMRSYIHITCNAETDKSSVTSVKNLTRTGTCYFLFEIETKHICTEQKPKDNGNQDKMSDDDNEKDDNKKDDGKNSQPITKSGGSSGMSFFSIFLIVILLGVFFYFTIGILYKRIYLDARGWEQLPNSELWVGLSDKCVGLLDRIRYGGASRPDRYYSNIETGAQAFSQETEDANDDNLLSM